MRSSHPCRVTNVTHPRPPPGSFQCPQPSTLLPENVSDWGTAGSRVSASPSFITSTQARWSSLQSAATRASVVPYITTAANTASQSTIAVSTPTLPSAPSSLSSLNSGDKVGIALAVFLTSLAIIVLAIWLRTCSARKQAHLKAPIQGPQIIDAGPRPTSITKSCDEISDGTGSNCSKKFADSGLSLILKDGDHRVEVYEMNVEVEMLELRNVREGIVLSDDAREYSELTLEYERELRNVESKGIDNLRYSAWR